MTTTQPVTQAAAATHDPPGVPVPGFEDRYRITRAGTVYVLGYGRKRDRWRVKGRASKNTYSLRDEKSRRFVRRSIDVLLISTYGPGAEQHSDPAEYERLMAEEQQREQPRPKVKRPKRPASPSLEEAVARFEAHCRQEEIAPDGQGRYYGQRLVYRNGESQCPGWCVGERNGALYLWLDTPLKLTTFTELPVLLVAPWAGVLEVET